MRADLKFATLSYTQDPSCSEGASPITPRQQVLHQNSGKFTSNNNIRGKWRIKTIKLVTLFLTTSNIQLQVVRNYQRINKSDNNRMAVSCIVLNLARIITAFLFMQHSAQ